MNLVLALIILATLGFFLLDFDSSPLDSERDEALQSPAILLCLISFILTFLLLPLVICVILWL